MNTILNRIYKILFWKVFEIEKEEEIRLKTSFQLQFMKKTVKLEQVFIKMIDRVIIDLPAVERHLEGVIQMFSLEVIPIYKIMIEMDEYIDTRSNQRHLMLTEREWMFEQR
jgi:hypothetical protein